MIAVHDDPLTINRADWKRLLAGGFAFEAASFAVHPCDERRARAMIFSALHAKASLAEILMAAREHLKHQRCLEERIEEQIKKVERFVQSVKLTETKRKAWLITWEGPAFWSVLHQRESLRYMIRESAPRQSRNSWKRITPR